MNIIISLALLAIVTALGAAMYFLMNDSGTKSRTKTALMIRVGLSVGLIVFLLIGNHMGWIQPHGIQP